MNIAESMNYRFENPGTNIEVDAKIADSFSKTERQERTIEIFESWASMSKERERINSIISNYKKHMQDKNIENSVNVTR